LTVNVRNTTPGYPLQRVAELPSEIGHSSNIDRSQVWFRPVVPFDLESLLEALPVGAGDEQVDVASPGARAFQLNVQGSFNAADRDHAGAELPGSPVQPLPNRGDVGFRKLPDRQFPLRVGDGDEMQVTRLIAQQPVAFGDHLVPVVAAREPAAVATRSGGAEIRLTLLPVSVVLKLTGTFEPARHLLLPFAALLHRLKVRQTPLGHDLVLPTISTSRTAAILRETRLVHCFCPGVDSLRRRSGGVSTLMGISPVKRSGRDVFEDRSGDLAKVW
jgi:hypothetical protein